MTQALLFVDRNRFDYYDAATNRVVSFPFSENIIRALEIVSPTGLEAQINGFIDQNTLPPAIVTIILSPNVLFEKDLVDLPVEQQEIESQKFLDNVPFESLITKLIPLPNGYRVATTNKALCDALKGVFEKKGFAIDAVTPYEALGQNYYQIAALDTQTAPIILGMRDVLKSNSFPVIQTSPQTPNNKTGNGSNSEKKSSKSKARTIILGGVLLILLSILGFVIFSQS